MLNEKEKLDALARLGIDLNQIHDLDILMERILTEARRFVNIYSEQYTSKTPGCRRKTHLFHL
jgi:hypothetical protein